MAETMYMSLNRRNETLKALLHEAHNALADCPQLCSLCQDNSELIARIEEALDGQTE